MAIQNDNTLVTKGDLKALYSDKIAPYLGANLAVRTNVSDYYSTDEKIIGVWIDGKPLYQKTITTTIPTSSTSTVKNVESTNGLNVYNIQAIIRTPNGAVFPNEYVDLGTTIGVLIWNREMASGNYICIKNTNSNRNGDTAYITIQYTKTADAANSAVTTPGCYDINFPNTWPASQEIYFGNGVYGKRYTGTFSTTAANTMSDTVIDSAFRPSWKIVNNNGNIYRRSDSICTFNNCGDPQLNYGFFVNADGLHLRGRDNSATTSPYDCWITYTK